jgi:methionyl aminopeptidase|tara:strand:+ start:1645 stop:2535 length:891 start_codon:yes stop_codon:yes gene_type:complete
MKNIELYRKAGKIAANVMYQGLNEIKEGKKLIDVAEYVESFINSEGAKPAFPCTISLNNVAAHYSPQAGDNSTFTKGDIVKLDIGVHLEGYIADIAKTVIVSGGKNKLIKASEKALEEVLDFIKPGVLTNEIGAIVEKTISDYGYSPISNLTGHKLSQWTLHGGILIPNVETRHGDEIKEGDVYAIEPFSTTGKGRVKDDANAIIFKFLEDKPQRLRDARTILNHVEKNYSSLPFAERWISNIVPKFKLNQALRQLISSKSLYAYHILKEKEKSLVAQTEHTVIIKKDGCEITTLI